MLNLKSFSNQVLICILFTRNIPNADSAKALFKSDLNVPTSQKKMKNKQIKYQIYQLKNSQLLLCHLKMIAKNLESIELIIPEVKGCSILVASALVLLGYRTSGTSLITTSMMSYRVRNLSHRMKVVSSLELFSSPRVNGDSCKRAFAISARSSNYCAFETGSRMNANSWCKTWVMLSCFYHSSIKSSNTWLCLRMDVVGSQSGISMNLASVSASATWLIFVLLFLVTTLTCHK